MEGHPNYQALFIDGLNIFQLELPEAKTLEGARVCLEFARGNGLGGGGNHLESLYKGQVGSMSKSSTFSWVWESTKITSNGFWGLKALGCRF